MIGLLRRLGRDQSGAVLIELAFAAPILAMMVIGVSDISIAYGKKLQLEQAAQRAIEKVAQTTGETTPEDTIKVEAVCQYNGTTAGGVCKTSPITTGNVTVNYTLKCDGVVTAYSSDCTGTQTEVRYIEAVVVDTYTPMFPLHFGTVNGVYNLEATAGVRVQ